MPTTTIFTGLGASEIRDLVVSAAASRAESESVDDEVPPEADSPEEDAE